MQEKAGDCARTQALDGDELRRLDAWWRAANYLSVGQNYLMDNPLLRVDLTTPIPTASATRTSAGYSPPASR